MCGILGVFPADEGVAEQMLASLAHRGRDAQRIVEVGSGLLGHALHAIVGEVPQPLEGAGTLLFNGEVYNWKLLAEEHGLEAENDAQLLLQLLDRFSVPEVRELIDGVYAFAYVRDGVLTLERDVLGVKPLWYSSEPFAFASEKKALEQAGLLARELHPRTTLRFEIESKSLSSEQRPLQFPKSSLGLDEALLEAVRKRIPDSGRVGVLFSGGVDSSLVAALLKQAGADVTLYVASLDDPDKQVPKDLGAARSAAKSLGLPLVEVSATLGQVEELLPVLTKLIEDSSVVKVGVALPFYFACERAAADGQRVLFSGLGAEEVFAGYQRHLGARDINKECLRGLRRMHERDLYRDDVVSMSHTLELRLPLLDHVLVGLGLSIPGEQKVREGMGKIPLREAAVRLGLPESIAWRKKRAAQYGSQFDAALDKLARRSGKSKSEYLRELYPVNARLAALLSGGKDSIYALYTMQRLNYEISCAVTIISENPDSYMYHTPLIGVAAKQADAMGIPCIEQSTSGKKEDELGALRSALLEAIDRFAIEGVVSGALFSDYQRTRIEGICEEFGLRVYAPLWHLDQEQEVREIIDAGFTFVLCKVAADGLDESHLGVPVTHEFVDMLASKLHLNVAGEGGEYESVVIDGPIFSAPIELDTDVVCEQEGSVRVCHLVEKS